METAFSNCLGRVAALFVFSLFTLPQPGKAATFLTEDQTLAGSVSTVTVPIKVTDFDDVGAMQFTLSWDPTVLSYSSLGDFNHSQLPSELFFFGENHFNLDHVADGKMPVLYEQLFSADATLDDGETVFSVTFNMVGPEGSFSSVAFTDDPTPRKLASFDTVPPAFFSQNGTIRIGKPSDTSAPVITLLGSSEMTVAVNTSFTDPGSIVSDDFEQGLSAAVTGSVDTSIPGTYILVYNATDPSNNAATPLTRTVNVVDQTGVMHRNNPWRLFQIAP
jgi:hypothetical protein